MMAPGREPSWQGAGDRHDRLPLPRDDRGGQSRSYPAAFDALVEALWADDGAAADDLLGAGVLGVDDVIAYGPAVPYQTEVPGALYVDRRGRRLAGGGRLPVGLARPPPPTPLGQAVAMGALDVVDALLRNGARPWPTAEALLNAALATLPAEGIEPDAPGAYGARPIDAVPVVLRLLEAFAPTTAPDPWDLNPLTTLRMALAQQYAAAESDDDSEAYARGERARRQGAALLGPLLARYSPDALAAPAAVPGVHITLADADVGVPRPAAGYDAWRVRRAGLTERDALATDLDAVMGHVGFAVPRSASRLRAFLEAVARAYDDADDWRRRRDDTAEEGSGVGLPPRPSPWLSVASMGPRNLDAMLTTRQRSGVNAPELARYAAGRARAIYAVNGCADYVGCASLLVEAIGRDNASEVGSLMGIARGLAPDAPLDGHRLRTAGSPLVLARWVADDLPPSVSASVADVGGPAGGVFTTPLAMAAGVGAQRVMQTLVDAGARPWPTVETVLAPALARALATDVQVLATEGAGSVDRLSFARIAGDRNDDDDDTAVYVTERPFDAAAVVDLLTGAFPRAAVLGPWDLNPLTVARAHAIRAAGRFGLRGAQRHPAVGRLLRVLSALIDAGYSAREPTAGSMVRAPYTPPRDAAPTEVDAAVWTAARLPARTLAHALATAAVGLYAAREAWADARDRPTPVTRFVDAGTDTGVDSAAWVLVGDQHAWEEVGDDDDLAVYDGEGVDQDREHEGDRLAYRQRRDVGHITAYPVDDARRTLRDHGDHNDDTDAFARRVTRRRWDDRPLATGHLVRSAPAADDGA
ncbi:hypothetical protein pdul_cds_164 [Pandoravirus dulcis]|uniref:Uncharacterized protein n=1 Tax=Pandoravirus dulcis TaxID=1349409 RepID=S4VP78_9VIRU|nr:hypothetical protein pdul_cds_164 [Pandoravirus dulcis]AGO82088.1 hypothetical protein pdul_cds_164 [Pandoravirus dulcis]